jgi:hypothetical protein
MSNANISAGGALRAPAVPLVTHDPYFSVWSTADKLTDEWPKHWTGANNAMCGLICIDGKPFRFMGPEPVAVPAMTQKSVTVWPTRSVYEFEAAGVALEVEFLSPLLTEDIDILTRPATYVTLTTKSLDGKAHDAAIYFDCSAEWVVNRANQKVEWSRYKVGGLDLLSFQSEEQPILEKKGDDLRIDWGKLYLAVPEGNSTAIRSQGTRNEFAKEGDIKGEDDLRMPRAASDNWPVLACAMKGLKVGDKPVERKLILAYDDIYSVEYLGRKLPPIWRKFDASAGDMIQAAEKDYVKLRERCRKWDEKLMAEFEKAGGVKYAQVAALAYRQCISGHKIVEDVDGKLLMFSKENFSNGCMCTVDVSYPSSPFFMRYSTPLLKAMLTPILDYSSGPRWRWPFAPHDLGTYPLANGQVYGGGERTEENQMPVEECGNMLVMVVAACKNDGNAKYAEQYWPTLTKWAEYLRDKGLDPENQLCTDDFAGHMAHNVNLSAKAIIALGSFGMLCEMKGDKAKAKEYRDLAKSMADKWVKMADDGTCFRLAFDRPGTWSQKYNLVWDRILGLDLFPAALIEREVKSYVARQNKYGLPLDVRADYTKIDWTLWTACLTGKRADFDALFNPMWDYLNETTSRVPLSDWHDTKTGAQVGFQARTTVGGLFLPLLIQLR